MLEPTFTVGLTNVNPIKTLIHTVLVKSTCEYDSPNTNLNNQRYVLVMYTLLRKLQ